MEKIKHFIESEKGKDIMVVIIVVLVGLGSFELGRLSKDNGTSGIKIEYTDQNMEQEANVVSSVKSSTFSQNAKTLKTISNSASKNFFASNRGTKYYSIGCSAGKTIKIENRVYFETKEEAERAGYGLSSSCR